MSRSARVFSPGSSKSYGSRFRQPRSEFNAPSCACVVAPSGTLPSISETAFAKTWLTVLAFVRPVMPDTLHTTPAMVWPVNPLTRPML